MAKNQLPEGVGKKIVEALKRQAESDITSVSSSGTLSNNVPLTNTTEFQDIKFDPIKVEEEQNDSIVEEDLASPHPVDAYANSESNLEVSNPIFNNEKISFSDVSYETSSLSTTEPIGQFTIKPEGVNESVVQTTATTVNINIPSNVAVLKNLIMTLPVGVTKQTGAQIIRQTLEAMGLPMSSVLKEAQEVQEELNSSTRECMLKIQEYKTNIMQLEQSVQEYQKNINQINDIVSLFLMTDRK